MRKRGAKIKHKRQSAPTIVALEIHKGVEAGEYAALMALKSEWGWLEHFNVLLDTHAMLLLAAEEKNDRQAVSMAQFGQIALDNIRDRFIKHKVVRGTGDEINALTVMVEFAQDWWKRQSGTLFADTDKALEKLRAQQKESKT